MKKFLILIITFCFSADNIALVTKSKGDVKYKKNQSTDANGKLSMGTPLFSNDLIKTGNDGFAIFVYLDDKSMIKVQKNSEMYVRGNVDKGEIQKEISMNNGLFKASIQSQKGGAFTIVTPTSVASVKGTEFWVVSKGEEGGDQFFGLSGLVEVRNKKSNQVTRVTKSKTAISNPDGSLELRNTRAGELPVDDTDAEGSAGGSGAGGLQEIKIKFEDDSGNQKDLIIKAVE